MPIKRTASNNKKTSFRVFNRTKKISLLAKSGASPYVWKRLIVKSVLAVLTLILVGGTSSIAYFVLEGKRMAKIEYVAPEIAETGTTAVVAVNTKQFPIGVNPHKKEIIENPVVPTYFEEHVSVKSESAGTHTSWFQKAVGRLALMSWYQNLASLSSRILVIEPGERKEQIAEHFAKILGWNSVEKEEFLHGIESTAPELTDGKFFPGAYTVARGAAPDVVIPLVTDRFKNEVLARYGDDVEAVVPLSDTLIIASLLEREAYDFEDMRLIAGVIWNRLFIDMNLQIDATLQYAKGSTASEPWWPRVKPSDKYIASIYNTYKNSGLPPAPIANPSLDSILAALNPRKTDCMYYFHDRKAGFHCSKTYQEHVASLKQYYGQGK